MGLASVSLPPPPLPSPPLLYSLPVRWDVLFSHPVRKDVLFSHHVRWDVFFSHPVRWGDWMRCCRSDWPGLCLFIVFNPRRQQSWFGSVLISYIFHFTPPLVWWTDITSAALRPREVPRLPRGVWRPGGLCCCCRVFACWGCGAGGKSENL